MYPKLTAERRGDRRGREDTGVKRTRGESKEMEG